MDTVDYLLTEKSPRATQPENISIQLKPHQLASLYRMCMIDRDCGMTMKSAGIKVRSNIAILADLAGYGKTITFLALIEILKTKDTQWMPQARNYTNDGYGISMTRQRKREHINTSLIVVPDNLVDHWQRHLDNFTDLLYELVEQSSYNKLVIEDYDVILCPAQYYNKFIQDNREYVWNRVAFDEADSINIPSTEHVEARFLWFITATYDNISNRKNKGFLKSLFKPQSQWDDPIRTYFFPVVVKGDDDFVQKSFTLIPPEITFVECLTPNFIQAVRNHITPHVLELISAGDLDGAITLLGGDVDTDRNIITLVTRGIKNNITSIKARIETLSQLDLSDKERQEKHLKLKSKLESLYTRKQSLKQSILESASSDCIICCDTLKHTTIVPCCNNMFCAECLLEWMKTSNVCPMCRSRFDPSNLKTISTNNNSQKKSNNPKHGKIKALLNIIKENPEGQYIIFSGHSAAFTEIAQSLEFENIQIGVLTTALRTESTLSKFRRGDIKVILLDAEHNGAGIEIPQATDIILFHQMKKSLEIQAIARAQRPGRIGKLKIWKLKYRHEYNSSTTNIPE